MLQQHRFRCRALLAAVFLQHHATTFTVAELPSIAIIMTGDPDHYHRMGE